MGPPPSSISSVQRQECYFVPVIVHLSLSGEIDANVHGRTVESSFDVVPVIPLASSHRTCFPASRRFSWQERVFFLLSSQLSQWSSMVARMGLDSAFLHEFHSTGWM